METDIDKSRKRRKANTGFAVDDGLDLDQAGGLGSAPQFDSLRRSISLPAMRRYRPAQNPKDNLQDHSVNTYPTSSSSYLNNSVTSPSRKVVPSPVQLSTVSELPSSSNIDTVSLKDLLGDPLIKECWLFNYLFDVDFIMAHLDEDTRNLVQVKIVHGSWKKEDSNRIRIDEAVKRHSNVQSITAYMPEAYGTHHSKMIILFRHDDQAQVIIVTANFTAQDWRMCQAVWRSPLLPIEVNVNPMSYLPALGTGARFKHELLAYLRHYGSRKTGALVKEIQTFDFGSVKAALIASAPSKINLHASDPDVDDLWGWPSLKRILGVISSTSKKPHIVIQISSLASVGEKWLDEVFFKTLSTSKDKNTKPTFSVMFPTADEIRRSLEGYSAGGSIHMKIQSAAQLKQLTYLRPFLCHWAGDGSGQESFTTPPLSSIREAGRKRASPNIKTYIRFADDLMTKIDWAMMTSANLSTQAWGAAKNSSGEVRICSYEIGIVVWPALWDEEDAQSAEMVPLFKKDTPESDEKMLASIEDQAAESSLETVHADDVGPGAEKLIRVGWRMPYDLPLVRYGKDEMPWCATAPCEEPDWMGRSWPGFS